MDAYDSPVSSAATIDTTNPSHTALPSRPAAWPMVA
jgi:hypothetical protein